MKLLLVFGGEDVITANAGDSRAVMCRGGEAVELSYDHKQLSGRCFGWLQSLKINTLKIPTHISLEDTPDVSPTVYVSEFLVFVG